MTTLKLLGWGVLHGLIIGTPWIAYGMRWL